MYSIVISCVLFALCCMVKAQQDCQTADGKTGECVVIFDCAPLLALVNKPDRTADEIDLLKRAKCGFKGNSPAVCCPKKKPATKCYTPEGNPGDCMSLNSCPSLQNILQPPVEPRKIQYVERSKCIGSDDYSVCCGPVPDFNTPVQKGQCPKKVSAFPPDPLTGCCGVDSNFGDKIVGGTATAVDEYPWLVLIEYDRSGLIRTLCGGVLISGRYVLTAGHCVLGEILMANKPKNIRLGEYDTSHDGADCVAISGYAEDCTEGEQRIPIEKTIPHPEYNPPQKKHDIALIRMAQQAPYTEFIRPICLPTGDLTKYTLPFNVTVAGWGAVNETVRRSDVKLKVNLPFVTQQECQPAYQVPTRYANLWRGQICAGGEEGKDSCKGDSGGPLMYKNNKIFEVVGIVSFGPRTCGLDSVPGVYSNVYEYAPWIRSTIVP